jgi:type IV secretory pathway VirJ component
MRWLPVIGAGLAMASAAGHGATALTIDGGALGRLEVQAPARPDGLVFLVSGDDGLSPEIAEAARHLVELGFAVAPVDLPGWIGRLAAAPGDCLYVVSDIEAASKQIQRQLDRPDYRSPIVAGTGRGATAAYAALAQAPAATLEGAASDGFLVPLATDRPLCAGAPATLAAQGYSYGPKRDLPGWWTVAPASADLDAAREFVSAAGLAADSVVVLAAGTALGERIARLVAVRSQGRQAASAALADLPLIELPADVTDDRLAIVWSGDGGWRDLDRQIAQKLASEGVAVVGVDSLRYFWSLRTPEEMAADLAAIIGHYTTAWRRSRVILIGYSFGADVLPFAFNRLPGGVRTSVTQMSLLGLSTFANFQIHVTSWLADMRHADSRDTAPELSRLQGVHVQCFYGEREDDTACTGPELRSAELIRTKGGHHFDGDYDALARHILAPRDGG